MYGIQPTWPSDSATNSSGKRSRAPQVTQSDNACAAPWYVRASDTARGASRLVTGKVDDDPMCTLTTVPVSSQAANSGSQWVVWMLGSFRCGTGFSEKQMAYEPLA